MPTANLPDIEEIEDTFGFFDDWESRFQYVIELGRKLSPLPESELTEANRVHGCQASVWMVMDVRPSEIGPEEKVVELRAISDAHIVNGLIAILLSLYNGKQPAEVTTTNAEAFFEKLGLEEHLSPTRRNGLHSMLKRVRMLAAEHAGPEGR